MSEKVKIVTGEGVEEFKGFHGKDSASPRYAP